MKPAEAESHRRGRLCRRTPHRTRFPSCRPSPCAQVDRQQHLARVSGMDIVNDAGGQHEQASSEHGVRRRRRDDLENPGDGLDDRQPIGRMVDRRPPDSKSKRTTLIPSRWIKVICRWPRLGTWSSLRRVAADAARLNRCSHPANRSTGTRRSRLGSFMLTPVSHRAGFVARTSSSRRGQIGGCGRPPLDSPPGQ